MIISNLDQSHFNDNLIEVTFREKWRRIGKTWYRAPFQGILIHIRAGNWGSSWRGNGQ